MTAVTFFRLHSPVQYRVGLRVYRVTIRTVQLFKGVDAVMPQYCIKMARALRMAGLARSSLGMRVIEQAARHMQTMTTGTRHIVVGMKTAVPADCRCIVACLVMTVQAHIYLVVTGITLAVIDMDLVTCGTGGRFLVVHHRIP